MNNTKRTLVKKNIILSEDVKWNHDNATSTFAIWAGVRYGVAFSIRRNTTIRQKFPFNILWDAICHKIDYRTLGS